mmetsp:Transcript_21260/g.48412  ORF Transcript_21260/g.48412 Transcript_21260/m.48412 type:complete len:91 (+) Transcript_21260:60-332(+)
MADQAPEQQPVQQAMVVGAATMPVPPTVPSGSSLVHENYAGSTTIAIGIGGCLCCGCLACLIFACPVDERDVYVAPDGTKYTVNGAKIEQ